jgi:hypothetical protein
MEYTEKDIVKHYGLYDTVENTWIRSLDGFIFAVTCPRVAEVQLNLLKEDYDKYTIQLPDGSDKQEFGLEVREVKP